MTSRPVFGDSLRAELGAPEQARRLPSSPRSRVWQAELSGTPVVIKQLVDAPEANERYAREAAALTLASRVDPPVVPRLLGADPAQRLLVLEHVPGRKPGEGWLVDYATALARLHAAPAAAPGLAVPLPVWSGPTEADIDSFLGLAAALGVAEPVGVREELRGLLDRLAQPPRRVALLHGDPCPDNDLHSPDGVRFVDFEQASLGNGIVELAYLRIGFPTCWCVTVPSPAVLDAAEAAYRRAWREATDADIEGGLVDACAGWLIRGDALVERARRGTADHLAELPTRDWEWGTGSARRRLAHRLGVVSRLTDANGPLRALGELCAALHTATLSRWPHLGTFPARRPDPW